MHEPVGENVPKHFLRNLPPRSGNGNFPGSFYKYSPRVKTCSTNSSNSMPSSPSFSSEATTKKTESKFQNYFCVSRKNSLVGLKKKIKENSEQETESQKTEALNRKIYELKEELKIKNEVIQDLKLLLKQTEKKFTELISQKYSDLEQQLLEKNKEIKRLKKEQIAKEKYLNSGFSEERKNLQAKIDFLNAKNQSFSEHVKKSEIEAIKKDFQQLESINNNLKEENNQLRNYIKQTGEFEIEKVSDLTWKIHNEITQLNKVVSVMVGQSSISLAQVMIAGRAQLPKPQNNCFSVLNSLKGILHEIEDLRNLVSDQYAESITENCKAQ